MKKTEKYFIIKWESGDICREVFTSRNSAQKALTDVRKYMKEKKMEVERGQIIQLMVKE